MRNFFWRASALWTRLETSLSNLDLPLLIILAVSVGLTLYRLNQPDDSLIFDEAYYAQAARVMLGMPPISMDNVPGDYYSGGDFNKEHPPLAKLLMAGGTYLSGGNSYGFRIPSVLLGLAGLLAVYALVCKLTSRRDTARWAVAYLAFENLYFVHSRVATLDIYVTVFCLLGVCLYCRSQPVAAGIALGLGTLCKVNALFSVAGLFLYEILGYLRDRRKPLAWKPLLAMSIFYASFTYFSLGALDCYWTEFRHPAEHMKHILTYGTQLAREAGVDPQGIESTPLQWWLDEKGIDYLSVSVSVGQNSSALVRFRGIITPYLIAAAPFALYFSALRARNGDRMGLLVVCLTATNYGLFLLTWLRVRRISYLYYMLPSIPYLVIAIALMLQDCPRWARWVFLGATMYAFASYFPFRWR